MVNSGSSANLLAFSALSNFKLEHRFKKGDKIIIPAINKLKKIKKIWN